MNLRVRKVTGWSRSAMMAAACIQMLGRAQWMMGGMVCALYSRPEIQIYDGSNILMSFTR